jgi:hypothetical protein
MLARWHFERAKKNNYVGEIVPEKQLVAYDGYPYII